MELELINHSEISIQDKNREEIKGLIRSYMARYYGVDDVELTIEEINYMDRVLRDICRQKIHTPQTTMPMEPEAKQRISDSRRGYIMTEEHKERIRENSMRINVFQYDMKTGELVGVWKSTREAGRNGYSNSSISKVCRGERKSAYGFFWAYKKIDDDEIKLRITVKKPIKKNQDSCLDNQFSSASIATLRQ